MADYYTRFSFEIKTHQPERIGEFVAIQNQKRQHALDACDEGDDDAFYAIYSGIAFEETGTDRLWVRDLDGCGNVDAAIGLVQSWLDFFDIDDGVAFEWSVSCSKPRLDGFGGGGVVVTRKQATPFVPSSLMASFCEEQGLQLQ
ncbi:MAG: hypothetical protein EOM91_12200 [Sphingobacteriia bacterium]|nr:hypothetical protein [Sphingobacteriia bacterium]